MAGRPREDFDSGTIVETRNEKKLAKPRLFKVLLHNDHYTTREFVVGMTRLVERTSDEPTLLAEGRQRLAALIADDLRRQTDQVIDLNDLRDEIGRDPSERRERAPAPAPRESFEDFADI